MAKYVCVGGYVYSKDGDGQYIGADKLPELYNVDRKACTIISKEMLKQMPQILDVYRVGYTFLYPKSNGEYNG